MMEKVLIIHFKFESVGPVQWLMPIPGTWEAEIGGMAVHGQPGQKVSEISSQPTAGHVAGTYHPSYLGSVNMRIVVQTGLGKNMRAISKITKVKRAGSMAQVVKCLPSKCKALSSTGSTTKKKNFF
jgi:hypothetical protein